MMVTAVMGYRDGQRQKWRRKKHRNRYRDGEGRQKRQEGEKENLEFRTGVTKCFDLR